MKFLLLLSSLALAGCPLVSKVSPYCPAAEAAVGLICGAVAIPVGDPETGDFDGTTAAEEADCIVAVQQGKRPIRWGACEEVDPSPAGGLHPSSPEPACEAGTC